MLESININFFYAFNHFAGKNVILDGLVVAVAQYLWLSFILVLIYLWFGQRGDKKLALYAIFSTVLGLLFNFFITLVFFHPRPFMKHMGTLLLNHAAETSFPSDHTTLMLSIAFMLLYFKKSRHIGLVLSFCGLIGGLARVYCGLHFPLDIFGSVVVASVSSSMTFLFKKKLEENK